MRVANAPSRNLFLGKSEFINLALPFLFLVLFFIERSYSLNFGKTFFERIIVDIFLLDLTHNAFTFFMLLSVPELREWKINQARSELFFWMKLMAIILTLFCIFLFLLVLMKTNTNASLTFYLILIFFPMHHSIYQSFGLSLAMNRKMYGVKVTNRVEKFERLAIHLFFVSVLLMAIMFTFEKNGIYLKNEILVFLRQEITHFHYFAFLLIICITFFYPKNGFKKKTIFSARYLVWALSIGSPISIIGTRVIHGFEYLFVTQKMTNSSSGLKNLKVAWFVVLFVSILGLSRSWLFNLEGIPASSDSNFTVEILASISLSITFSHYYLDRVMFRMRNKINRDTVGRLLIGSRS